MPNSVHVTSAEKRRGVRGSQLVDAILVLPRPALGWPIKAHVHGGSCTRGVRYGRPRVRYARAITSRARTFTSATRTGVVRLEVREGFMDDAHDDVIEMCDPKSGTW